MVVNGTPGGQYPIRLASGVTVITAPADIDVTNAGELRAALLAAGAGGSPDVVVDMTGTAFCDSAGLGVLVRARKLAVAQGAEVRLVITEETVLRLFAVTGTDRMFPIFTTLGDALAVPSGRDGTPQPGAAQAP
jgi:anti-sigma B factor antagonist